MRENDRKCGSLFSYVGLEVRIPTKRSPCNIRQVVNEALAGLDAEFEALYVNLARPSIPPER